MPENQDHSVLVPLGEIDEHVLIDDMNYSFYYQRVKDPESQPTTYFNLHYKENQQENWLTCKSMLSDRFTIAKTNAVIQQIQSDLEGAIENEKHFRHATSVKSSFTLSGYQIDVADEPENDKLLFQLITNINTDLSLLTTSNLTFNLINGFSGNRALQLNYGLLKSIKSEDEENTLSLNNIFILESFTKRLIHDNHLSITIEDVTNVQREIQNKIETFKNVEFDNDLMDDFVDEFPRRFVKQFASIYENLPSNFKNFYYVTYILSTLLEAEKKINLELKLRNFIFEYIDDF